MRNPTLAPLRIIWREYGAGITPAIAWVWRLEVYCVDYYNGDNDARQFLVPY